MEAKPHIPPQAVAALHEGRKVEAIKLAREALGVDLKEAKQRVEAYLAADPLARASFAQLQARSGSIALRWSIGVACLGAAAAYLWWSAE
jgi:hypothetical protein